MAPSGHEEQGQRRSGDLHRMRTGIRPVARHRQPGREEIGTRARHPELDQVAKGRCAEQGEHDERRFASASLLNRSHAPSAVSGNSNIRDPSQVTPAIRGSSDVAQVMGCAEPDAVEFGRQTTAVPANEQRTTCQNHPAQKPQDDDPLHASPPASGRRCAGAPSSKHRSDSSSLIQSP